MKRRSLSELWRTERPRHGAAFMVFSFLLMPFLAPMKLLRPIRDGWRRGIEKSRFVRRHFNADNPHNS